MTEFSSVEDAYESLALAALAFPAGRAWDCIQAKYGLLTSMVSAEWGLIVNDVIDDKGEAPPRELRKTSMSAARFLRDDLLKTTGQRIWGLTFTLYPDGKFNIEYDYNKPEGYEETDDVISGDEINASLGKLAGKGSQ